VDSHRPRVLQVLSTRNRFRLLRDQGLRGFTLLEVVLAIALCGAVMALLTTAIDLYLIRVDRNRTRVETAQLARTLLTQIGNDLRSVRLAVPSSGAMGSGGLGGIPGAQAMAGADMGIGGLGSDQTTLGIFGTQTELRIDRSATRGWDAGLLETVQMLGESASQRDMPQTVIYFFNDGRAMTAEELSAGGVVDEQSLAGFEGLARQMMPTAVWLSQSGSMLGQSSSVIKSNWNPANTELLAPEVIQMEFSYFDGWEWYPQWDTSLVGALPQAIQIRLTIFSESPDVLAGVSQMDRDSFRRDPNRSLEYRLVVRMPQIQPLPQQLSPQQAGDGLNPGGGFGAGMGGVP